MGPVEVLVISFPGNQFTGDIIPELQRLTDDGVISVVDGLLAPKDGDGEVTFFEFEELGEGDDAAPLAAVLDQVESLVDGTMARISVITKTAHRRSQVVVPPNSRSPSSRRPWTRRLNLPPAETKKDR